MCSHSCAHPGPFTEHPLNTCGIEFSQMSAVIKCIPPYNKWEDFVIISACVFLVLSDHSWCLSRSDCVPLQRKSYVTVGQMKSACFGSSWWQLWLNTIQTLLVFYKLSAMYRKHSTFQNPIPAYFKVSVQNLFLLLFLWRIWMSNSSILYTQYLSFQDPETRILFRFIYCMYSIICKLDMRSFWFTLWKKVQKKEKKNNILQLL